MRKSDDTVSRQAAIDTLFELYEYHRYIDPSEAADLVRQGIYLAEKKIEQLPSAQPEDAEKDIRAMCGECDAWNIYKNYPQNYSNSHCFPVVEGLPSAEPEHLIDDDFETIRIHLDAYKEKLCNQGRWKEAKEYQRIYDRFMAFVSAQPERDIPLDYIIDEGGNAICPKCGANVEWHKYCGECGQALKWEKSNE